MQHDSSEARSAARTLVLVGNISAAAASSVFFGIALLLANRADHWFFHLMLVWAVSGAVVGWGVLLAGLTVAPQAHRFDAPLWLGGAVVGSALLTVSDFRIPYLLHTVWWTVVGVRWITR